jgi:hypothetical protein
MLAAMLALACSAGRAHARADAQMLEDLKAGYPEFFPKSNGGRYAKPMAVPDIFGPGNVLNVGNVYMKVTNYATIGNPFTNLSTDPSGQWPGSSGIEYLSFILLSIGGVNPTATDPTAVRRVSYFAEWRPKSLDPEDRVYRSYDGLIGGQRLVDDDHDQEAHDPLKAYQYVDEDFQDGRDNDGDGLIDEDYGAIGQQMFSCVMRDDTEPGRQVALNGEKHVPLGLEMRQIAFAYSVPGFQNFNAVQLNVFNRSGHVLDSLTFGFRWDLDAAPADVAGGANDDQDVPWAPNGDFTLVLDENDPRRQKVHTTALDVPADSALCPRMNIRINGFSVADDDGDQGRTPGVGSILLLGHTTDPLGISAPRRVGFRAFRSFPAGTPYAAGGNPTIDQQRFELMTSQQNIDPATGLLAAGPVEEKSDITGWVSVGPFLDVPNNGSIECTLAFAVQAGLYSQLLQYPTDYQAYADGRLSASGLFAKYPILENAFTAQVAYEGVYERPRHGFENQVPDRHGAETGLIAPPGTFSTMSDCREDRGSQQINEFGYTWFDFDCDYCTGVFVEGSGQGGGQGYYLKRWNAEAPPPNPALNVSAAYNFTDNTVRGVAPAGDNQVTLSWDNLSEVTVDPKTAEFDFRSYRVWKVSNWKRPVGTAGPNDEDWALIGEFRLFNYADSNFTHYRGGGLDTLQCPRIFVPDYQYPANHSHCNDVLTGAANPAGCRDTATVSICLYNGDFWNKQTGQVLRPTPAVCPPGARDASGKCLVDTLDCVRDVVGGPCHTENGKIEGTNAFVDKVKYPVGRYRLVDREVKNGFVYFYAVTAADSSSLGATAVELSGRRSAVEAEAVVPQASTKTGRQAWVVPNPYRGYTNLNQRPSSWDLIPNATDPTGTHIDFMGMPPGVWTIRIYTVAGDLVQTLNSSDAVNESVRGPAPIPNPNYNPAQPEGPGNAKTIPVPGYNRQQDTPNDGEARWNLISRNGQDVTSGIYIFVIESGEGTQRGRFVVIR